MLWLQRVWRKREAFLLPSIVTIAHLLHPHHTVAVASLGSSWLRPHGSARRNRDAAATCTEVQVAATWEGSTAAAAQAAACAAAQAAACTEEAKGIHPVAGEAGQDGGTGS